MFHLLHSTYIPLCFDMRGGLYADAPSKCSLAQWLENLLRALQLTCYMAINCGPPVRWSTLHSVLVNLLDRRNNKRSAQPYAFNTNAHVPSLLGSSLVSPPWC
jgi:hypothetical protein